MTILGLYSAQYSLSICIGQLDCCFYADDYQVHKVDVLCPKLQTRDCHPIFLSPLPKTSLGDIIMLGDNIDKLH